MKFKVGQVIQSKVFEKWVVEIIEARPEGYAIRDLRGRDGLFVDLWYPRYRIEMYFDLYKLPLAVILKRFLEGKKSKKTFLQAQKKA